MTQTLTFTIDGQPYGFGKNHANFRRGNSQFAKWKREANKQLMGQVKNVTPFTTPVHMMLDYVPGDRRVRDATAILDGILHFLEASGIVENDKLIKKISYVEHPKNPHNPRIQVTLFSLDM